MSVQPIGSASIPDPAANSYPSGTTAASGTTSSSGSGTSATSASQISSYQAEYNTLQEQDAAELLQVSFASPADAQANVASVLAQAAALQNQQLATQQQQASAAADAAVQSTASSTSSSSSSSSDPLAIPTLTDITAQSDTAASTAIDNYLNASPGSSFETYA
jgi:hypothetical protein